MSIGVGTTTMDASSTTLASASMGWAAVCEEASPSKALEAEILGRLAIGQGAVTFKGRLSHATPVEIEIEDHVAMTFRRGVYLPDGRVQLMQSTPIARQTGEPVAATKALLVSPPQRSLAVRAAERVAATLNWPVAWVSSKIAVRLHREIGSLALPMAASTSLTLGMTGLTTLISSAAFGVPTLCIAYLSANVFMQLRKLQTKAAT